MTQKQLMDKVMTGTPMAVLEYRGTQTEKIAWRDKDSGKSMEMRKATHNCEAGTTALAISEGLADNADLEHYKPPFKKGDMVVWEVQQMARVKGVSRLGGRLELLEK
jgi:hypothetical protein